MPAQAFMSIDAIARGPRLYPALIAAGGFAAGLGWAFVGSLMLGLGMRATEQGTALAWLAGEALIGAAMLAALLLGSSSMPTAR